MESSNHSVFPKDKEDDDYVDSWYHLISDLTFKTWTFHFDLEEGALLHRLTRCTIGNKSITEEDQSAFNVFLSKVSGFFKQVKSECSSDSGFFLRLGSRSFKDAVFYGELSSQRFENLLYTKYLLEYNSLNFQTREDKISWVNQKNSMQDLYYFTECDIKALKCHTLKEMFDLFFNSERILIDLGRELKHEKPNFSLNFRLWEDRLFDHLEFRGFVYHHKLCALTQYDNRQFFKDVYDSKELIQKSIQEYYETKVRPRIDTANSPFVEGTYVIDFGIIFKNKNEVEVLVIEINRYQQTTGASLFDWKNDIDVLTGKKEFEFRIVNEHQYDNVDYDTQVYPEMNEIKKRVKARIVNENKSFIERWITWREDVTPLD
ncbi:cell division cycle protein [Histomonas meleagridis]|uniref:cell division cycle protein n=1 Tax=Histomonas meleagridis TaxID=135588 RepID=UPI003559BA8A|nr:cell division cycle protein [Histomonas meleagridis]KAH0796568.1 cell division cycle protein [Histomonas meleagridis]